MRYCLFLVGLGLCLSSCNSNSSLLVEKKTGGLDGASVQKMVSIDPEYIRVDTRKSEEAAYINSDKFEPTFNEILERNARRRNIQLNVIDSDQLGQENIRFFNELQPLKEHILRTNFRLDVQYADEGQRASAFRPAIKYLDTPPVISSRFAHLAEVYGTPYFAVHRVFSEVRPQSQRWLLLFFLPPLGVASFFKPETDTYYYQIVTNVVTGETIYREARRANSRAGKNNLEAMIYDSFLIFTKDK